MQQETLGDRISLFTARFSVANFSHTATEVGERANVTTSIIFDVRELAPNRQRESGGGIHATWAALFRASMQQYVRVRCASLII